MIEIEGVTRKYGNKVAVDGLSLRVEPTEIFAFLGPNGAGKTTTIKMLVGLLRPNSGTLRIDGIDVVKNPRESSRLIGYVPDQPHIYEKLSGREFLTFVGELYGMRREPLQDAIEDMIEVFELQDFVDHLGESYSHGMRQRLAFGAALIHQPKVLILDEPMVGLDPRSMRIVKTLLKERSRKGMTVFMSTHTLTLAEEVADKLGVCLNGNVRFVGTIGEFARRMESGSRSLEDMFLEFTSVEKNPMNRTAPSVSEARLEAGRTEKEAQITSIETANATDADTATATLQAEKP